MPFHTNFWIQANPISIKTEIPPGHGEIRNDVPNVSVRKIWIGVTTEKSGKSPTLLLQNYQQIITITITQFYT